MSQIRRSPDRRRRVLYQSHVSPPTPSTPATRRAAEELRAARQPANDFGSRVHRHLRGRWFSLVPVSRLAITVVACVFLLVPAVLTLLHHLAGSWPTLANRQGIARPFYIHRPDSFAAWWTTMVLVLSAGATWLIYVLRLHRRDDYRGHYQLWRLTLAVLLLASVHSIVGLVDWVGALLELIVGDRAVLSGANWFRIVLDVGGIILAMRLVAEVHRCRPALVAMLVACCLLGCSEAAAWQLFAVDSLFKASLVTAAPMLGWSSFLVAATIYLRSMYRQIRNIPVAPTIRQRVAEWIQQRRIDSDDYESDFFETEPAPKPAVASVSTRNRYDDDEADEQDEAEPQDTSEPKPPKRGLFARLRRRGNDRDADEEPSIDETEEDEWEGSESDAGSDSEDSSAAKPKRRWFGLRAAKPVDDESASEQEDDSDQDTDDEQPAPKKKRWFSLRLKPQRDQAPADEPEEPATQSADEEAEPPAEKKKGWFAGLFKGKQKTEQAGSDSEPEAESSAATKPSRSGPLAARNKGPLNSANRQQNPQGDRSSQSHGSDQDDELIDPDEIDWNSMNKAERRRMRKKLKRAGRAA